MCGIAGIIELKGNLTAQVRELIAPMTKCLRHRGPDATNYFHHQQFCYGNSRLAIMDPSSHASLPFCTPSKDLVLCFNGEISNFEELARRFKLHENILLLVTLTPKYFSTCIWPLPPLANSLSIQLNVI